MAIKAAVKSVPQRARNSALDLHEYVRAKSQPFRAVGYRLHEYISRQKRTIPCGLPETGHEPRGIRRVDATVREASPQIHPDDAPTGLYTTEHDSPEDESRIGDARISYTCNPIIHGLYREKPASLIIFDFDLNYDNTCAITRADIIITFGSSITDQLIRPHDVEIVPYATRLLGPKKACQEVSDATHTGSSATWRLKLNVSNMGMELPERADTISGTRTDSGWRLVGGPIFVDKPFRVRRVFRWRLTGHEFNRFPVPECFSVGMTVQHNMVDFWMKVRVEGALRGVVTNGMAKLSGWKTHHPNGWRVQPKRIERDINQSLLMREMQGKWLFDQWDPKEHEEENRG
ncbi:hypothetical protein PCL_09565 [Purpureocillium lilacinum]|uniref:Uncharacterized protein n=1 Tax=Purpureocillium lilacinum TaxID=33203 RepID=A0A2U3DQM3_PURLI|nr:hypothetical protein PCL_09565 [Purpureocillium lilacinum]